MPTLDAISTPTKDISQLRTFADKVGYPIMIKAVDGGGGRGIRLITSPETLEGSAKRAVEESPSRQVFAEQAAIGGFRHIEIQIVGDSQGNVRHLWERECSIQRRYQKIVEIAPSPMSNRKLAATIIEAALRMARKVGLKTLISSTLTFVNQCTDQLLLSRHIRIPRKSGNIRILFLGDQPSSSSGAHDY